MLEIYEEDYDEEKREEEEARKNILF